MKLSSAAIVLLLVLTLVSLDRFGRLSRHAGPRETIAVDQPSESYAALEQRGVRGATMVVFSEKSYFSVKGVSEMIPPWTGFPLTVFSLADEAVRSLNNDNVLWVAMEKKLLRRIIRVLPPGTFQERLRDAGRYKGLTVSEGRIEAPFFGSPRSLATAASLPAISEPVVVFVDPTYFREELTESEAAGIRERLKPSLVIVCGQENDASVTGTQRAALKQFISLLTAGYDEKN